MTSETTESRVTRGGAAFVLGVAYLLFATLYAWQASRRVSPTIFSDEIEFTQISRGIAETGTPSRLGEPSGFETLYTYVVAPVWWLGDTAAAWEAAKLIGVLVMCSTLFFAYGLARMVVSRAWAIGAAVGSIAAPPLAYAPYLLEEPLAYPVSTATLWAIAVAVARPALRTVAVAAAACIAAALVRGQLGILLLVFAVGMFALAWRTARFAAWRSTWSAADWVGLLLAAVGIAVTASAELGRRSEPWYVATGFFKGRVLDHAVWSLAAVGIGIAVLPLVAMTAALLSRRLRADPAGHAFVLVGGAAVVVFVGYAAVKGAYLSTVFSILIVERNLIYLVPVALAATAAVLSRRIATPGGLAVGLIGTLVLVLNAEFRLDQYPYFEAPSLAIAALTNRNFSWDHHDVENALVVLALASFALLAVRTVPRTVAWSRAAAVAACVVVGSWALTTEIYAARGLNLFAERLHGSTPRPADWVDRATGGAPVLYLGQRIDDANQLWLLNFWNRSIEKIWSLDGTAPIPTLSPDLGATDGTLKPPPDVDWVVAGNGVEVIGERVGKPMGNSTLFRVDPPVRLRYAQNGVSTDGWMSDRASYSQYGAEGGVTRGFARIALSRQGACSDAIPTANVVVRVGEVVVRRNQPAMGEVWSETRRALRPCALEVVVVPATVPYHVQVEVDPTFVPAELDASSGDRRQLGAQVGFGFLPLGSGG